LEELLLILVSNEEHFTDDEVELGVGHVKVIAAIEQTVGHAARHPRLEAHQLVWMLPPDLEGCLHLAQRDDDIIIMLQYTLCSDLSPNGKSVAQFQKNVSINEIAFFPCSPRFYPYLL